SGQVTPPTGHNGGADGTLGGRPPSTGSTQANAAACLPAWGLTFDTCNEELMCSYPEGHCFCSSCGGREGFHWMCASTVEGCPFEPPRAGESCRDPADRTCAYIQPPGCCIQNFQCLSQASGKPKWGRTDDCP